MIRAFLVDDEPLALKRLARMLADTNRVAVVGQAQDPIAALETIPQAEFDVLFLDIEMPAMNGFQMLEKLDDHPLVIFATAYNQYAIQAFEVNSIGYLLKPVEREQLDKTLDKLDRIRAGQMPRPEVRALLEQLAATLKKPKNEYPDRVSSKLGERVEFIDLSRVTHFFAEDKLTYAATEQKNYCVDSTIVELEARLDPKRFVRIHRSTMVNVAFVHELYSYFSGRMLMNLRDAKKTELTVARDRVKALKDKLGV